MFTLHYASVYTFNSFVWTRLKRTHISISLSSEARGSNERHFWNIIIYWNGKVDSFYRYTLQKIPIISVFAWSIFWHNWYFWQCSALKLIHCLFPVHYNISNKLTRSYSVISPKLLLKSMKSSWIFRKIFQNFYENYFKILQKLSQNFGKLFLHFLGKYL